MLTSHEDKNSFIIPKLLFRCLKLEWFFLFVEENKIIFGFRKNTIAETVVPLYIMHVLCCPASCLPRQQIVRKTS